MLEPVWGIGYYAWNISGDPVQDAIEELLLGKADFANRAFGDTHRHLFRTRSASTRKMIGRSCRDLP